MNPWKTIVVGYDETEPANHALERAAELATVSGATVIVTSVARALVPAGRGIGPIDPVDPLELHEQELRHAKAFLKERGIDAIVQPALGDPAASIVEVAETEQADLIIVGTHQPGMIERLLEPSISAGVSRRAHCDVLIVH